MNQDIILVILSYVDMETLSNCMGIVNIQQLIHYCCPKLILYNIHNLSLNHVALIFDKIFSKKLNTDDEKLDFIYDYMVQNTILNIQLY